MISQIKLTNFRKFKNTVFEFKKNLVIFYGHNAQGKSSVLEALYLINTGLSPWASTNEFVNVDQSSQKISYLHYLINLYHSPPQLIL